jgi:hypothetical protein
MNKYPLIGGSICAVILLVLGSQANVVGYQTQTMLTSTKCETGYNVTFICIDKITFTHYWDEWEGWVYYWTMYANIKNTGLPIPDGWLVGVDGEMYRSLNPNKIVGSNGFAGSYLTPWATGEVKSIPIIKYGLLCTIIPGKFHLKVIIEPTTQTSCKVLDNDFFMFVNYIFPKE